MERLSELFESFTGKKPERIEELSSSGSHRRYFRMVSGDISLIGVTGIDREENKAFIELSNHFLSKGINVPEVFTASADGLAYIQEDLGDGQLYSLVTDGREKGRYGEEERNLLCKAISLLPKIQFKGAEDLDFNVCYPDSSFNGRMVDFDLNYFKYCFLKVSGLEFNEVKLQDDFDRLRDDLLEDFGNTFMYRDFQSRNIMVKNGEPYFIDFQGGRRGPILYDVASFIWQAKSRFPEDLKEELTSTYISALREYIDVDETALREKLRIFILFRTLQVLGAYGFRGYFEKKPHFLESIPFALGNIRRLINVPFERYPYLSHILQDLSTLPRYLEIVEDKRLEVQIVSFAYKRGLPTDNSGNGGGYIFDCRSINNPGKYEHYRQFTGLDPEVVKFLEDDGEVFDFLDNVYSLTDSHIKRFLERKFTHLQIGFGCTGGQHRSVYCAEKLAAHLSSAFDIKVSLKHRELGIDKIF